MNGSESRGEPVSARSVDGKEQEKWGREQDREEPEEESAEGSGEENDGGKDGREDEDHYSRGFFKNLDSLRSIRNGTAWACAVAEAAYPSLSSCEITAPSTQLAAPVDREIARERRLLQEKGLEMRGAGYLAALLGGDAPTASDISNGEYFPLGDSLEETRIVGGASNQAPLIRNTPNDLVMACEEARVAAGARKMAVLTGESSNAPEIRAEPLLRGNTLEEARVTAGVSDLVVLIGDELEGAMVQGGADDRAGLIGDEFGFPNDFPNGFPNGFPNAHTEKMPLRSRGFGCAGNRKLAGQSGETWEEGGRREKAWKEGEEVMQGDAEEWDVVPSYIQKVVAAASCESGNAEMDTWLLEDIMPLDG
ncbi:unnamed protein product [Closterium sp. NIES-65]|nr:unnamed protein product [Closterium sp. NIES-65]